MTILRASFLVLLIMCGAATCGGARPEPDSLSNRVQKFNKALRWARPGLAAELVLPIRRDEVMVRLDAESRERRIADVETLSVRMMDEDTAEVHLRVEWTGHASTILKKTIYAGLWRKADKSWFLGEMKDLEEKER